MTASSPLKAPCEERDPSVRQMEEESTKSAGGQPSQGAGQVVQPPNTQILAHACVHTNAQVELSISSDASYKKCSLNEWRHSVGAPQN
jgi:hypothetical protein